MSTRSNIGIKNKDGSIHCIYCHFDGYLEHNGLILERYYKDQNKVKNLINLGDISSLGLNVYPDPEYEHTFDNRQKYVTVAYSRDRGEDKRIKKFDDMHDYMISFKNTWYDYAYLYDEENKEWLYSTIHLDYSIEDNFKSLKHKLNELNLLPKISKELDTILKNQVELSKKLFKDEYQICYESEEDCYNNYYELFKTPKGIENQIEILSDYRKDMLNSNLDKKLFKEIDNEINLLHNYLIKEKEL